MKLFRMKTLATFGIGFLAGSAAGPGPWQKAQSTMDEMKGKISGSMDGGTSNGSSNGNQYGSTASNGIESQRGSQGKPAMTEM
jgi:hypothetical protein